MATLSATRYDERIRSFYDRPVNRGKAKKEALIACTGKLLVIPFALVKNGTYWNPEYHASSA